MLMSFTLQLGCMIEWAGNLLIAVLDGVVYP